MSHKVCHDVGTWVNQNISQQLQQCVEQNCNWWCLCCNKWFCFLVWVIVTIVTWVVQTVCEIIADVVDVVVNVLNGLADIIGGILAGDGTKVLAGLGELFGSGVLFILELIPIATLGTLVGAFRDGGGDWLLRDYVRGLIEKKYTDDPPGILTRSRILEAVGVNSGGFGLRLKARALRSFVRSDVSSQPDGTPDLIIWKEKFNLDLRALAGFDPPEWWNRTWPELVGDGGDISRADLDDYIAKRGSGADVKHFTLFAMSKQHLQTRLDTATQHGSELGLMFQWTIEDVSLTDGSQILIDVNNFANILKIAPFSRHEKTAQELCAPMVIAGFGFAQEGFNGYSALFAAPSCLEIQADKTFTIAKSNISGAAFRGRKPDIAFKYTAIHELGHTFGLCHVDGLLRIMYTMNSAEGRNSASWWSLFQYWTSGAEAGFILDEGKKVWDYIMENFPGDCLSQKQF